MSEHHWHRKVIVVEGTEFTQGGKRWARLRCECGAETDRPEQLRRGWYPDGVLPGERRERKVASK